MPWEEKVIVTMREEFVKRVLSHEKSKAELCREYGISRPTGDKWIERYLNGQPLCDQVEHHILLATRQTMKLKNSL